MGFERYLGSLQATGFEFRLRLSITPRAPTQSQWCLRGTIGTVGSIFQAVFFSLCVSGSALSLSACGGPSPNSATTSIVHSTNPDSARAIAALRSYLVAWHQEGEAKASRQYLEPDQWVKAPPVLVLRSGKVISFRPYKWKSGATFAALVKLNLNFSGSSGAWNRGTNDRFVTFTRSAIGGRYLMDFYTGFSSPESNARWTLGRRLQGASASPQGAIGESAW